MTDVRKAVTATDVSYKKASRPSMTRRTTPQTVPKLGKNPRDREREWEEDRWWDDERESFPQYWYVVNTVVCVAPFSFSPALRYVSPLHCVFGGFPSEHFHFQQPALSPDMQVIGVTPACAREGRGGRVRARPMCGKCRGATFLHMPESLRDWGNLEF
jgi:hypothetical protein